jgi:serine protease Do
MSAGVASGRPVLIGPLEPMASRIWSGMLWELPPGTDVTPGTFLFSPDGALAGVVASVAGRLALVPGETVVEAADALRQAGNRTYGELGIEVQPLTPDVAASTRAPLGVVVTAVDPQGPAASLLEPTDVIVGIGDEPLVTYEQWLAVALRATVGQTVVLRAQRNDEVRLVAIVAAPKPAAPAAAQAPPLGLTLRTVPRVGAEIVAVAPGSAAAAAGMRPGDIITVFGDTKAPTQSEVREAFAAAPADRPVLAAVTRGTAHHVLTLEKR